MSIELARDVLRIEAEGLFALISQIDDDFINAVDFIMQCPSRVIISGIGKSGIIGQKISATFNSTGTASFFLHPVEAMHGDLGVVDPRDVILAISYSGETAELNLLLSGLKKRGTRIIAITGNKDSSMADLADAVLSVRVPQEACPLGLAPTASTTATLAMGDALAVVLLQKKGFKASDFRKNHPGGSLGERLKVVVSEVMLTGASIPSVHEDGLFTEAVKILNEKNLGAVLILSGPDKLSGIITDGDVRRIVIKGQDFKDIKVTDIMTRNPKAIGIDKLAADALSIMQQYEVTVLPVINDAGRLAGILHLQDLLGKGEFRFLV